MRDFLGLQKFRGIVGGAEERAALRIVLARDFSRLVVIMIPAQESGAERATGVARGRLDPDFLEKSFTENPAVADTIERNAAGQTEIA